MAKREKVPSEQKEAALKKGSGKGGWAYSAQELAKKYNCSHTRFQAIRAAVAKKSGSTKPKKAKKVSNKAPETHSDEKSFLVTIDDKEGYDYLIERLGSKANIRKFVQNCVNEMYQSYINDIAAIEKKHEDMKQAEIEKLKERAAKEALNPSIVSKQAVKRTEAEAVAANRELYDK